MDGGEWAAGIGHGMLVEKGLFAEAWRTDCSCSSAEGGGRTFNAIMAVDAGQNFCATTVSFATAGRTEFGKERPWFLLERDWEAQKAGRGHVPDADRRLPV